tara:strand:- start:49 stop:1968 length:1920 start_codon:yes stop_codon:yes gene_type:complete
MKIAYKSLIDFINTKPDINELSNKLFQLGHEHEISDGIFDMEFTPNRGDCFSVNGLLRDLNIFYETTFNKNIYRKDIDPYEFNFINHADSSCKNISFLKLEIEEIPKNYNGVLKDYFFDLGLKKNNFFTDVSNYISYETGQPTHCYDAHKLGSYIKLAFLDGSHKFKTLLDKTIELKESNLVFLDKDNNIINLAGIVGGESTSCNKKTTSVVIECAHFNPEDIIGKSVKYNINSEAAHKFERNTDPGNHNHVLRRFLKIIEDHSKIKGVKIYEYSNNDVNKLNTCTFKLNKLNKILGTNFSNELIIDSLTRLGFIIKENTITIPSHRHDVNCINDIAEEFARSIGYNNIDEEKFSIFFNADKINDDHTEKSIKNLLINNGFFEVINDPFTIIKNSNSIIVDNPLDSNRKFLRTELKHSLTRNLLYNERRQNDSVKLFEIANVFDSNNFSSKKVLGIIASGRVDKNYKDFTKKINNMYLSSILDKYINTTELNFLNISRESLGSKLKEQIIYLEIELNKNFDINYQQDANNNFDINNYKYEPISEFPSSKRDLSFSIKKHSHCKALEELLMNYDNELIKEKFIFDYYNNEEKKEIKIGFRFVFQSITSTITDKDVDIVVNDIVKSALKYNSVSIPGYREF